MSDPRRLREEGGSALELALLDAGRSAGASTRTRVKALAALGLAGPLAAAVLPTQAAGALAVGSAAAPAPVAAPTAVGALAAKLQMTTALGKVMAGLTLAGVTAAVPLGTIAWRQYRASHADSAIAGSSTTDRGGTEMRTAGSTEGPEGLSNAGAVAPGNSLSAELTALDTARFRLSKGDASGALGALDDYQRAFPGGRLALEAEVLRIDALARAGRGDAAKNRAATFLREHPGSVLAPRVRGHLGD